MRTTKKILSMILAFVMVLGLIPATAFATESNVVYISISFDGDYINDKNSNLILNVPVSLDAVAAVDLDQYGLSNMWYDAADPDGDGKYDPTALQLIIYAHENLYGGNWSDVDFSALPGSSYFNNGVFGFTANLIYFLNGKFAVDEAKSAGSGLDNVLATSDHIILEAGDRLQMSSFSCWSFYTDEEGGLDSFADNEGNFVYEYAATAGEPLSVNMKQYFCDLMTGKWWVDPLSNAEVCYGTSYGTAADSFTIDESGHGSVTFQEAGTYYLWTEVRAASDMSAHEWCTAAMAGGDCMVSTPAIAKVTVAAAPAPEQPRQPQSVTTVLNAAMAQLAATVTEPVFGTAAGEWTVFGLARGGYYTTDHAYFTDYYDRIVATVNETAASVNMHGALDDSKSTENSRLIMALASIGKDATAVGNHNLVAAYRANGMPWIAKQGFNGPVWALIALDSNHYEASDSELRETLIDYILGKQHNDGGWSLYPQLEKTSNVDITGMTLTALAPYKDRPEVAAACAKAIEWLSSAQQNNGDFAYDESAAGTVESCAWAIVGLTEWGINPDTDLRFVKSGKSAVDALLSYYLEDKAVFEHAKGDGGNAMGTDQATYALVAYDRFINGKTALFDYSDVTFDTPTPGSGTGDPSQMNVTLSMPDKVENAAGKEFNAQISIDKWDNDAGYKLIDFLMTIPDGLSVTGVSAGERLAGGSVAYNLKTEAAVDAEGKKITDEAGNDIPVNNLRCVYFDSQNNQTLTITDGEFPAIVFTVSLKLEKEITAGSLKIAIGGMSVKLSSDSTNEDSMIIVNTAPVTDPEGGTTGGGSGNVGVVTGVSFSAVELYKGDNIDLIPDTRKAVAVAVTGIDEYSTLVYNDGTNNIQFQYSDQITAKTKIPTYVALVDSQIAMTNFIKKEYFTVNGTGVDPSNIAFGDANSDNLVNADDALAIVNAWLRKSDAPTDNQILRMNVNGDSRINTFDALGIVEAFVNSSTYGVVTKAATLASEQ